MCNQSGTLTLDEILKNERTLQAVAVKKGGKRFTGRHTPGPKPSDICRAFNGRGHWTRSCPFLNEGGLEGLAANPRFSPEESRRGQVSI